MLIIYPIPHFLLITLFFHSLRGRTCVDKDDLGNERAEYKGMQREGI